MANTRLKRLPRIPGSRKRKLPTIKGADPRITEASPDELQDITRTLGGTTSDEKIAKRVMRLKEEFPGASLPELVTYDWLQAQGIPFEYQAMLYGGRRTKGGLVPDFIVVRGSSGLAWQIQGEYWHSMAVNQGRDETVKLRLLGTVHKGIRIDGVVELWEKDVYRQRPRVFQLALGGIGLRG